VSTCIHEPTTGAIRPEKDARRGEVRGRSPEGRVRPLITAWRLNVRCEAGRAGGSAREGVRRIRFQASGESPIPRADHAANTPTNSNLWAFPSN
jgi:hypothetical protein